MTWRHDTAVQVHRLSPDSFVIRQSLGTSFEAPFIYLLFGTERAILVDTGAVVDDSARADAAILPLRAVVDGLVSEWLALGRARVPLDSYELVVAHSHAHGDHVAADGQFADRPNTVVVGHDVASIRSQFRIADWPRGSGSLDLGGRSLEVLPIPGHHAASIAIYDPHDRLLLTGDTVYPGRLYIDDFPAFLTSLDRLAAFVGAHPVTAVLGAHVEMSTSPRRDFAIGTSRHRGEAALPLGPDDVRAIAAAARASGGRPGVHRFDGFTLWIGPCRTEQLKHRVRSGSARILGR
jgi:glyoxylase-like metal-dependent hydrolase (beta-lactamase superfamily II)